MFNRTIELKKIMLFKLFHNSSLSVSQHCITQLLLRSGRVKKLFKFQAFPASVLIRKSTYLSDILRGDVSIKNDSCFILIQCIKKWRHVFSSKQIFFVSNYVTVNLKLFFLL